ncbi:succinate dehydrogenase, cytochrome b556 subunit [Devosia sp. RR2S18]|uniref:succinate dehydrogenase, cytochrome b556 subunit n=1 Tax=Devosia rhizosphaerae TaxID=3049774 RepID=UPI00253F9F23|nr:succinate dehydrogenase, cytochrome b556 subunit [Devosia sp. RR2S18]WIJ26954.1 succinate dehydrogenase, cytochrome b556 subunit [Devosia sp. RR2S18]
MVDPATARPRPLSPHIQIYRPQLTSVLSIGYRITGVVMTLYLVGLVVWLIAAASGPPAYSALVAVLSSWVGQALLFAGTFAFFWHLCGGIRHLAWDTGRGFELRSIYISGWLVVGSTTALTLFTWIFIWFYKG